MQRRQVIITKILMNYLEKVLLYMQRCAGVAAVVTHARASVTPQRARRSYKQTSMQSTSLNAIIT